jgi:predicted transcriptional regulator
MDFERASQLGACLSKDYAAEMFRLLVNYRSLSASEAASRLDLHVQTAQSFLETLASLGLLDKEESLEKSRPYFRYSLKTTRITLDLDLASLAVDDASSDLGKRIRERRNAGARFTEARGGNAISSVAVWSGEGRSRDERKLTLTEAQGAFLYHLPFPGAEPLSVAAIMKKAGVDESSAPEILDIVGRLEALGVVEARPTTVAKPARALE